MAPYAVSLCQKLSEAYLRLLASKGGPDDEDNEQGLTADGLMTAIRRILHSISGKFPTLYPQLEVILEGALRGCLSEEGVSSADEGLTCVSELIYNQDQISPRMWGFFQLIIQSYLDDTGVLDDALAQAAAPLITFMAKAPESFTVATPG